jgi:biopolymer transport protein ExbD
MAFSSGSSSSPSSEINVTPLIDVLLVLLIIFMVVLPTSPSGLESSVPQGQPAAATQQPVVLRLLAGVTGHSVRYEVAGEEIGKEAVSPRLTRMFAVRQDRTIFVQADRSLSYQDVAEVVSEAREAGAGAVVVGGLH